MDQHLAPRDAAFDPWSVAGPVGVVIVAFAMLGLALGTALSGASLSPLTWYLARASGMTLYLLLWLSVVSGLGMTTGMLRFGNGETWRLHRFVTEMGIVLLALHLLSLALDPSVPLGLLGVLVPFASDVRQPWTDFGILSGWGMLAIGGSFALRGIVGWRGWRLLHMAAFPLWAIALLHGIGAGSDAHRIWAVALYALTTGAVLFLIFVRLFRIGHRGHGALQHAAHVHDRVEMRRRVERYRERCES